MNQSGIIRLDYCFLSDIQTFNEFVGANNRYREPIYFSFQKGWKLFPMPLDLSPDSNFWTETLVITKQGRYYEVKVATIFPSNSAEGEQFIQNIEAQKDKIILRVTDANNQKFLLGTTDFPLRFFAEYSSTRANFQCTFSAKQPRRAIGYDF